MWIYEGGVMKINLWSGGENGSRTHPRLLATSTGFEVLPLHRKRRSSVLEVVSTLTQIHKGFK